MFKIPRQSYTAEFKREAAKMVEAGQRPAEVARRLGAGHTMRTARSRTSGEKRLDLFMAPFSQDLEPPQNPGRFRASTL
jgi:transposase-like protein